MLLTLIQLFITFSISINQDYQLKLTIMKTLKLIAWISSAIGVLFMLVGFISAIRTTLIRGVELVNYFHVANSFFLITIALFIYLKREEPK